MLESVDHILNGITGGVIEDTVDGVGALIDHRGRQEEILVVIPTETLLLDLAKRSEDLREASSRYGAAGNHVKSCKESREAVVALLEQRGYNLREPELPL